MPASWSIPIPQPMQQHGGHPRNPPKAREREDDPETESTAPREPVNPQARQAAALKEQ